MPRTQGVNARRNQRIAEQQAVLDRLRSGQGIAGARPANPIIGAIQSLTGVGAGSIPTLYGAELGGQEVLLGKGGWNQATAASGPINVGGQTWYPAQKGQDLIYKRAPGKVGGQYGSILERDQLAAPAPPTGAPEQAKPAFSAPIDPFAAKNRAYQQERARVEAMVKANPDMQKQEIADARAKVRDQGMAIWAAANPTLAKNLQPGQVGYDAVQQALIGNEAGEAMRQGYGFQMPQQVTMTPPPGVNVPQGLPSVNSFSPGDMYGQEGIDFDPELRKKFQSLLNATQAK